MNELLRTNGQKSQQITSGFAKLGGGVTTQTVAGTRTAGDSPDGVWLHPQLRKAAGALAARLGGRDVGIQPQ